MTETGLSLGTPHYMSPEQASADRDLSSRSDVYSLGCVLYEMIAGQPPHTGPTAQSILVRILTEHPRPLTELRHTVPPNVASVVAKSIEKLPADRFESAAEFGAALADESFAYQARPTTPVATPTSEPVAPVVVEVARPWHREGRFVAALLVAVATTALAAWGWLRPEPPPPVLPATRALVDLGDITLTLTDEIIVSPDGSRFAVAGAVDGQRSLYWRDAAEETFRVIPGTGNAAQAAFSPDGDWIVYSTQPIGALLKVSLSGGAPTPVVPSGNVRPFQPHWGDDGTIVFTSPDGMYRVPDTGGEPELLREPGQDVFLAPSLLPGGAAVIGSRGTGGIMLLDLETDSVRELIPGGLDPQYVETGHILYADASGGLWAIAFDASRGEVVGGAVPIFDGLSVLATVFARYSVSRNGTLVYGAGGGGGGGRARQRLLVVDLDGSEEPTPLEPRLFIGARWAPDGESVAYQGTEPGESGAEPDIYTYNVALRTAPRPLTFEGANRQPVWSPDGTRVAFASNREGTDGLDLFVKTVNDDSPPEMIVTLPGPQLPTQWPSDDLVVFESGLPSDLWIVDLSSDSAVASPYVEAEADLDDVMVSPDGDLAAYVSNESGTDEVYVRSFPEARQPEIVSQGGGVFPLWSPDGNTIYYWTLGPPTAITSLIATRIERGPPFVVLSRDTVLAGTYRKFDSDLHPDGDRLIISQGVGAPDASAEGDVAPERFLVVVNWFEELRARMGN